jgi:WD40 repeat protein
MALAPDGRTLAVLSDKADSKAVLTLWDLAAREPRVELRFRVNEYWLLSPSPDSLQCFSPDGRVLALAGVLPPALPLKEWADWSGLRWQFDFPSQQFVIRLLDVQSGRWLGDIPAQSYTIGWLSDGTALATQNDDGTEVFIWDIPPRKPLTWFLAVAASLALPLAWLARRRVRRLRRAAA